MSLPIPKHVYELAGQQTDALAEEVLAVLFTDAPERATVRPGDTRQHQQWLARRPDGASSRGWLSFAQPLTAAMRALLEERYESALRTAFVPAHASSADVTVTQTAVNELRITWTLVRASGNVSEGAVVLSQGVG